MSLKYFACSTDASAYLREHGPTISIRDDKGTLKAVIQAPELAIANKAQTRALKLLDDLLATHAAVAVRVPAAVAVVEDDVGWFDDFLPMVEEAG